MGSAAEKFLKRYIFSSNDTRIEDPDLIWQEISRIVDRLGPPFEKTRGQRGPKYTFDPTLYAKCFLFKEYFSLSYRKLPPQVNALLNNKCPHFTGISKAISKKMPIAYLVKACKLLAIAISKIIRKHVAPTQKTRNCGDSTGFSHPLTDGTYRIFTSNNQRKRILVKGHTKLMVITSYILLGKRTRTRYKF